MRSLTDFPDADLRIFERPEVPPISAIRSVYLIGICGTGMGSLAGLFRESGYSVCGSDDSIYPPMSTRLAEMNISVFNGFDAAHLSPAPDLVIVGNSCTPTHVEASHARANNLVQQSFPEAVAHFFLRNRRSLVVTGTHGKTTTSGLLVHILNETRHDPGFLIGGVMAESNRSYGTGNGDIFVVEGDEYDSSYFDKRPKFLHYQPHSAIVTSMEFDHADIYDDMNDYRNAFRTFTSLVDASGYLVLNGDDDETRALASYSDAATVLYGLENESNEFRAENARPGPGGQVAEIYRHSDHLGEIFLPMSGRHNLMNALAVIALGRTSGIPFEDIRGALATFGGMKRRQEVRGEFRDVMVIDDFAHHPTAALETLKGVSERWPGRRLIAVFEPRSNTSRRRVFETVYPDALGVADCVFLSSPPLRHNDHADDFMDIHAVSDALARSGTPTHVHSSADEILPELLDEVRPGDIILVMSNGGFGGLVGRLVDSLGESDKAEIRDER